MGVYGLSNVAEYDRNILKKVNQIKMRLGYGKYCRGKGLMQRFYWKSGCRPCKHDCHKGDIYGLIGKNGAGTW